MIKTSARPADEMEEVVHTYGNMLFRLCFVTLGNESDAQDALQEVFIKYMLKAPEFKNEEHKKAWLLKVAANQCKDIFRAGKRHQTVNLDAIKEHMEESKENGILEALMTLPDKFRLVMFFYYVEEYEVQAIAGMIGKTPSAVKMRLQKGRKLLKEAYEKMV